ncbi:unannotated protein [freshwater metagenome]|uniref:Unannotated protein n=1 Tax=freshwater metagenome TaxID=449393 RepID=A0A6J7G815_9ZZZZ|nr:hypothetical protein [Actinomycetota bacterium]
MRFTYLLDGDARQLRDLRAELAIWADPATGVIDDLLIVTNELAANALIYGSPPIKVSLQAYQDSVRIQVTQSCPMTGTLPQLASPGGERGRGLLLVSALSKAWGWSFNGRQLVVWAVLALPGNLSQ